MHEVVATAIIVKNGQYLITRRSPQKKRFPGMWTVPGGHLEIDDYKHMPKDKNGYWRNVLEQALKREVMEEVGLEIKNVEYVTSMALVYNDGSPSIIISCIAEYVSGDVVLQKEEADKFKWVSIDEAKRYPLVGGIYEELVIVNDKLCSSAQKNKRQGLHYSSTLE